MMQEKWEASRQDVYGNYNATSMYGDASFHIHQAMPITSVLPERVWMVPYRKNAFFTGREQMLTNLHTRFMNSRTSVFARAQAITGLGGIGKTQVAVEYAYRYQENYRFVLWVNAATHENLVTDIAKIADRLQLPERTLQEQEKIVAAVLHWLATHEDWLLIVDNADDLDSIVDLLPTGDSGHLLLTTRQQATGSFEPFPIQQMDQQEGTLFLLRRAGFLKQENELLSMPTNDQQAIEQIVREMAGLPLALDQAGAYIQETKCSSSVYLTHFRNQRAYLLKRRGQNSKHYPASVATTWSLSFERVKQQLPEAADVLRLCAFLSADDIPEEIIASGVGSSPLKELAANALLLDEVIVVLSSYSLLLRDRQERTLSIHRLVQVVLQDAMTKEEARKWATQAVLMTAVTFPTPEFAQWSACEQFVPHVLVCANWIREMEIVFPFAATLLQGSGWYLNMRGRYKEAELLYIQTLAIQEELVGHEHLNTASCLTHLGINQSSQGKYKEAEPLLKRALAIREQQVGLKHQLTAISMNNLALLYTDQGHYVEAEMLFQRALTIQEQDENGIEVSLTNLAILYSTQGKYKEAEPLLKRALAIQEQQVGPEHPHTALIMNNLGDLYSKQGKYKEAEPLLKQSLTLQEQQVGPEHPHTAIAMNNLGDLYSKQGKYEEAEPLLKQALAIQEQQLGPANPKIVNTLSCLAHLYLNQSKYEEAEPLYMRVLTIQEQQLGPEHPKIVDSLNLLALIYLYQKKIEAAEPLYMRVLTIQEQQLGPEHPKIIDSIHTLAELYKHQQKYMEAESLYTRIQELRGRLLGERHLDTVQDLNNLAMLYRAQEKYAKAQMLYMRALAIREQHLGLEHLDTAESLNNLVELYVEQEKYARAEPLAVRVLTIREQHLGLEHLDLVSSLDILGSVYYLQEQYRVAESLFKRSLVICERNLGRNHPHTEKARENYNRLFPDN